MKPFGDTGFPVIVKMTQYLSLFGLQGNTLVAGVDCKGGFYEERSGIPCAGHTQFQLAPVEPPQGTAEPLSQDGAASRKSYIRKGKKHCTTVEKEE